MKTEHLDVPLDHADPANPRRQRLRFWVLDGGWSREPDAPVVIVMPSEGGSAPPTNRPSNLTCELGGIEIRSEHRYFGESVPGNSSSLANLAFLSVDNNLGDQAALVRYVQKTRGLAAGKVVATGGSYAGASTCWFRTVYPDLVDAGVAESASIHAVVDFAAYDAQLGTALRRLSSRCETGMASIVDAIDRKWAAGQAERDGLKCQFGAGHAVGTPMGDADFLYMLGDALASQVQYGGKANVCRWLAKTPLRRTDDELVAHWANFSLTQYGLAWPSSMWYNSETMKDPVGGSSARSWYWLKCSELAYLQTSPHGLNLTHPTMRSRHITAELLLAQCNYIFPTTAPGKPRTPQVAAFNAKYGGLAPQSKGASRVLFLRFSDDPWQPAQPATALGPELPLVLTGDRNGSCAHCGAGCTEADISHLNVVKVEQLKKWGIAASVRPSNAVGVLATRSAT